MNDMGMTDKQFNGFIRFLIDDLQEAKEEADTEKKNKRIEKNPWKSAKHIRRLKIAGFTPATYEQEKGGPVTALFLYPLYHVFNCPSILLSFPLCVMLF